MYATVGHMLCFNNSAKLPTIHWCVEQPKSHGFVLSSFSSSFENETAKNRINYLVWMANRVSIRRVLMLHPTVWKKKCSPNESKTIRRQDCFIVDVASILEFWDLKRINNLLAAQMAPFIRFKTIIPFRFKLSNKIPMKSVPCAKSISRFSIQMLVMLAWIQFTI